MVESEIKLPVGENFFSQYRASVSTNYFPRSMAVFVLVEMQIIFYF